MFGPDRIDERLRIARVDDRRRDAERGQQRVGQPAARAERRAAARRHDRPVWSWHSSAAVIAAMPVAWSRHASAPSSSAIRSSSICDGRVLQPRIGHALLLAGEARGGVAGAVVGIARGEEERLAVSPNSRARGAAAHRLRRGAPLVR